LHNNSKQRKVQTLFGAKKIEAALIANNERIVLKPGAFETKLLSTVNRKR